MILEIPNNKQMKKLIKNFKPTNMIVKILNLQILCSRKFFKI